MEFRILGTLEVWANGERVALGGAQSEKLLAVLLLAAGRVVSVDALTEALWDGEPPASAKQQIHKLVANLRRRIPGSVRSDGPGYRIVLDGAELDETRFVELAATATVPGLTEALELWRGPALSGIDSRVIRTAAAALDERRLVVTERLVELRLAAGDAAAVAAQLPELLAAHPLRETLCGQLMVALHRCGRPAEAVAVYARIRERLAEELGLDPSPELARLHEQILRGDAALGAPARATLCTLPYDVPDFTGRDADLDRLLAATHTAAINVIDGMAGVGKTALAVHAAHRLADRYPDGQLFCDLHGHTPGAQPVEPEAALELLLRTLGLPAERIPDGLAARAAVWRSELASRRLLLVLDNAATAAQVRPLLPGTRDCLTLVTSRVRLASLEGAHSLSLDVLAPPAALALLGSVAGAGRTAADPAAAREVVGLCGHLPLAIRLAASRLASRPLWSVASLAARLRSEAGRLSLLAVDDRGVGAAFAVSYEHLDAAQQRLFGLLGLHPGADFDRYSVAALAELPVDDAEALLESLVDAHLLLQRTADRYTFHDLLREYARERSGDEGDRPRARLHDYYLTAATAATDLISRGVRRFEPTTTHPPRHLPQLSDRDSAVRWLTTEHANLLAIIAATSDWQLPCVLRAYFEQCGHFADWRSTHERALRQTGTDPFGQTMIRLNLGSLEGWSNRYAEGMRHFRLALHSGLKDRQLEASALTSLGMLAHLAHRDDEAVTHLERALALNSDDPRLTALAWCNLGLANGRRGHPDRALSLHRRALALAHECSEPLLECVAQLGLGETSLRLGVPALSHFRESLRVARELGFRIQEALALDGLAHCTDDPSYWQEALRIFAELGVAQTNAVREHLARPGERCCDMCQVPSHAGMAPAPSNLTGQSA